MYPRQSQLQKLRSLGHHLEDTPSEVRVGPTVGVRRTHEGHPLLKFWCCFYNDRTGPLGGLAHVHRPIEGLIVSPYFTERQNWTGREKCGHAVANGEDASGVIEVFGWNDLSIFRAGNVNAIEDEQ